MADQVDARLLLEVLLRMEKKIENIDKRMTGIEDALGLSKKKPAEEENPTEEDLTTAIELKTPRAVDRAIEWSKMDEELRVVDHNKKVEKPSMWDFNPKEGVPTELANLDPKTFLTSRQGRILCFFPKDILVRICSMLSACDFVHLSMTCRFLHWRMFTFCTCYTPYTVKMRIHDDRIFAYFWGRTSIIPPREMYRLYDGCIDDEEEDDGFGKSYDENIGLEGRGWTDVIRQYSKEQEGRRGLFVYQPFCLRKPFVFDTLELYLILPFWGKRYYDRCLPYILAVRGLACHLNLNFVYLCAYHPHQPFVNYSDTNDFLTAINVSYYDWYSEIYPNIYDDYYLDSTKNIDVYLNCPYARQMDTVRIHNFPRNWPNVSAFQNRIGTYWCPLDSAIIATLKNFFTGSANLDFHEYGDIEMDNQNNFPVLEYLFEKFGEFEEFFYTRQLSLTYNVHYYIWKKTIERENGGQLVVKIRKAAANYNTASVTIGKEEIFDKMEKKTPPRYPEFWWKMETAVEPDEVEELEGTVKSDKTEESDDVEDSEEAEEWGEAEEAQKSSSVF